MCNVHTDCVGIKVVCVPCLPVLLLLQFILVCVVCRPVYWTYLKSFYWLVVHFKNSILNLRSKVKLSLHDELIYGLFSFQSLVGD